MHRTPDPAPLAALRRLPRTPHPSWRDAGEAGQRRKPDAAEFWARLGG